ncbi:MAG: ATP-binding protein [Candidatus Sericytochromatia bacterium]|nr:ATP-binding protein [Candidatus Sericytochromatia bacterium]
MKTSTRTGAAFDLAPPGPSALLESLRAFGYDLPTALADILDNSIAARARLIEIDFQWRGSASRIRILDDGEGMTEARLIEAMRPGSSNPRDLREAHDLGRFGLGMKTASISQCRCLTVLSRTTTSEVAVRSWDLDYIAAEADGEWRLLKGASLAEPADLELLASRPSGTMLVWDRLDQVVDAGVAEDDAEADKRFRQAVDVVRAHLAMTFHRFLEGPDPLEIRLNTQRIKPWDPFLTDHDATQRLGDETLVCEGIEIQVKPYILPHHSRMTPDQHAAAAGPLGWNAHQGFYVYRNRRLLVPGDWLGLGMKKEEHAKLARIRVDLPNTADLAWQLDVKKSRATPPAGLVRDLRRIARHARELATRIYRHRGKVLAEKHAKPQDMLWRHVAKGGRTFYRINRSHPLVSKLLERGEDREALLALLALVEQSIPVPRIVLDQSQHPDSLPMPFEGEEQQLMQAMTEVHRALVEGGSEPLAAAKALQHMEPFHHHMDILEAFIRRFTGEQA